MTTPFRTATLVASALAALAGLTGPSVGSAQTQLALADTTVKPTSSAPAADSGSKSDADKAKGSSKGAADGAQPNQPAPTTEMVSGWVFGSFQYRTDKTPVNFPSPGSSTCRGQNAVTCQNFNQFTLDRAYLTFRTNAGTHAYVRVTTDIFQNTDTTKNNNGFYKGWVVRLKYAYLQYDYLHDPAAFGGFTANARIGILHTVVIDHEEGFWPRYLAQVALERDGWFSSADLGAATTISFPQHLGEFYATVTNGATDGKGYTGFASDRFKDVAARATITPFGAQDGILKTLEATGWYFTGAINSKFAADTSAADNGAIGSGLQRRRDGGMLGIKDRRLTAMLEYSERFDDGEFGSNTPASPEGIFTKKQTLVDGFAIVRPLEIANPGVKSPFGALFRYDVYKPDVSKDGKRDYLIGGIFWEPTSKTTLALDYQESKGVDGDASPFTKTFFLHFQAFF
jgi:hypothetical protein